jgi:hypothetical protein
MTSKSPASVARYNAVDPVLNCLSEKRPLLPPRLGRCMFNSAFTSTSAVSNLSMMAM